MSIDPRSWFNKTEGKEEQPGDTLAPTEELIETSPTSSTISLDGATTRALEPLYFPPDFPFENLSVGTVASEEVAPAVSSTSSVTSSFVRPAPSDSEPIGIQFNAPKKDGKGEDADPVAVWQANRGILAVFDGMGGAGSTSYQHRGTSYSGAYIASRVVAGEVQRLYSPAFPLPTIPLDVRDLRDRLSQVLQREATSLESESEPSRLKSKLIKRLPTTMAALLIERQANEVLCQAVWAGDSRCYALSPQRGLQQLTADDLKVNGDALENLKDDSPLSNCVSADGDFELRSQIERLPLPVILLSATDGCFGYLFSPAHFESLLLDTLASATDAVGWRDALVARLRITAGDDCSLGLLALGWSSFQELQAAFSLRRQNLQREFIEPLDEMTRTIDEDAALLNQVEERKTQAEKRREALRQQLWLRYRDTHDQFLKGNNPAKGGAPNHEQR